MLTWLLLAAGALPQAGDTERLLPDRSIRVGDLAIAPGHEDTVIGHLQTGVRSARVEPDLATRMVRNRLPATPFRLRYNTAVVLRSGQSGTANPGTCLETKTDLAAGDAILAEHVTPVTCDKSRRVPALAYDSERATAFATAPLAAGSYLGPLRVRDTAPLAAGHAMSLRFESGPVVVERKVVTLQPVFEGSEVFVRTEDGDVISALVASDGQ